MEGPCGDQKVTRKLMSYNGPPIGDQTTPPEEVVRESRSWLTCGIIYDIMFFSVKSKMDNIEECRVRFDGGSDPYHIIKMKQYPPQNGVFGYEPIDPITYSVFKDLHGSSGDVLFHLTCNGVWFSQSRVLTTLCCKDGSYSNVDCKNHENFKDVSGDNKVTFWYQYQSFLKDSKKIPDLCYVPGGELVDCSLTTE
jgi:hypothetical protein